MDLHAFFEWCDTTALGLAIRGNSWSFPLVETIHILAITVLLGSILMTDLRMLGLALRGIPVARLQRQLAKSIDISLLLVVLTGIPLFLSEAVKLDDNIAFRPKIILLVLAIVFHYGVHNRATSSDAPAGPAWGKLAAVVSIVLWFGVGAAGRAIGFV